MRDRQPYLAPYRQALRTHGPTFDVTLWRSRETQVARFDVLMSMIDLSGRRVLDAGCGLGDLAAHLAERGVRPAKYIGIDGLEDLVHEARRRGFSDAEFYVGDFAAQPAILATGAPEVTLFSGSLNTMEEVEARGVVGAAFEVASGACVFNFLSNRCPEAVCKGDTGEAHRFDTVDWLDWAMGLTPNVAFRQDYLDGHDATIAMYKQA